MPTDPTDPSPSLAARAAKHAALGEPARLAIVDTLLAHGDRSPTALRRQLGMDSNLLAHHLDVLERAGLVTRHRSEGDRRRSYLRLVPGALDDLRPGAGEWQAHRVVFVCTANSARSQLAAGVWRRLSRVPVRSAGTHPAAAIAPGALAVAARRGLPLRRCRPRALPEVATAGDLLVTVCDRAFEELSAAGGDDVQVHWSVPDPLRVATDAAFDAAFDDIHDRVRRLAGQLAPSGPVRPATTGPPARTDPISEPAPTQPAHPTKEPTP